MSDEEGETGVFWKWCEMSFTNMINSWIKARWNLDFISGLCKIDSIRLRLGERQNNSLRRISFCGVNLASIRFSTPPEMRSSGFWNYIFTDYCPCWSLRPSNRNQSQSPHSSHALFFWYERFSNRELQSEAKNCNKFSKLTSYFHTKVISGKALIACRNDFLYSSGISEDNAMVPNEMSTVRGRRERIAFQSWEIGIIQINCSNPCCRLDILHEVFGRRDVRNYWLYAKCDRGVLSHGFVVLLSAFCTVSRLFNNHNNST